MDSEPPVALSMGVTIVSRGRMMRTRSSSKSPSLLPEDEEEASELLRLLRSLRKSLRRPRGLLGSALESLRREQERNGLMVTCVDGVRWPWGIG